MLSLFLLDDEFEFFNFKNRHSNFMYVLTMDFYYRVILLTGSALKVLEIVLGRGIIFNPKIYIADFENFKQGFLSMKLIKRRVISGFRVCFFNNCIDIN